MSAISKALLKLSPTGKWRILGDDRIENIEWEIEPKNKPTDEEIKEEVVKQEKLIQDTQYQRDRANAYDPIPEQLDQIYHDIDGWKAKIKAVKDKYPKP